MVKIVLETRDAPVWAAEALRRYMAKHPASAGGELIRQTIDAAEQAVFTIRNHMDPASPLPHKTRAAVKPLVVFLSMLLVPEVALEVMLKRDLGDKFEDTVRGRFAEFITIRCGWTDYEGVGNVFVLNVKKPVRFARVIHLRQCKMDISE
jgi:hypothetical protein